MTEPTGWLDMSRFPDHDPDTVLTADQQGLLTSSLAVDDAALPDSVWEHLLAVVVGAGDPGEPGDPGTDVDPAVDDVDTGAAWPADLEQPDDLEDTGDHVSWDDPDAGLEGGTS